VEIVCHASSYFITLVFESSLMSGVKATEATSVPWFGFSMDMIELDHTNMLVAMIPGG
jgi:membrane-associated PAP2 superfamily phosphatase